MSWPSKTSQTKEVVPQEVVAGIRHVPSIYVGLRSLKGVVERFRQNMTSRKSLCGEVLRGIFIKGLSRSLTSWLSKTTVSWCLLKDGKLFGAIQEVVPDVESGLPPPGRENPWGRIGIPSPTKKTDIEIVKILCQGTMRSEENINH